MHSDQNTHGRTNPVIMLRIISAVTDLVRIETVFISDGRPHRVHMLAGNGRKLFADNCREYKHWVRPSKWNRKYERYN